METAFRTLPCWNPTRWRSSLGEGGAKYATPFYIGTGSSPAAWGFSWLTSHGQAASAGMPDILAPDTTGFVVTLLNLTK